MDSRDEIEAKIQMLLAKINHRQAVTTSRELVTLCITRSQFVLLIQFAEVPESVKTITQLVQVMDMNQPGVTKVVKQLLAQDFLEVVNNNKDKRIKQLKITKKGLGKCKRAMSILKPVSFKLFSDWKLNELNDFNAYLEKLNNNFRE